ncbi:1105_t:CDS:1, partial [Dentiscutata heterogama]
NSKHASLKSFSKSSSWISIVLKSATVFAAIAIAYESDISLLWIESLK